MGKFALWLPVLLVAVGCDQSSGLPTDVPDQALSEDAKLTLWLDDRYMEELSYRPISKAVLGIKDEDYGLVGDFSEEALDRNLAQSRKAVAEMKNLFDYEALSPSGRENFDLWEYLTDVAVAAQPYRANTYLFTAWARVQPVLPRLIMSWHSVESEADAHSYIQRIYSISDALSQLIARAEKYADTGIRPPYFAFENVANEASQLVSGKPFADVDSDNPVWADFKAELNTLVASGEIDEATAAGLREEARIALLDAWAPAYRRLLDWLEQDRVNADEIASGVGSLPNGDAYYRERVRFHTTTDLSPDEIHALGLQHVIRLHNEIEQVKKTADFSGSLQELFGYLRDTKEDPGLYFANTDAGRASYIDESKALLANVQSQLPDFFGTLPKAGLEVKRVESYRELAGAAQHYFPSTPDGSRPGIYYAHLIDMHSMPRWDMESVAYHEGVPGHHLQYAIARELEGVPQFRKSARFTAFGEGWGLYAEALTKEMNDTYTDPYAEIGRLSAELWRAIRLVVDTGLHAYGWTEQQAVEYMIDNSILTKGQARAEIRRYIVNPGQALAYMIGKLKLVELRQRAERRLGNQFDIREFHDLVLGAGALPLTLLERKVDAWLDTRGR